MLNALSKECNKIYLKQYLHKLENHSAKAICCIGLNTEHPSDSHWVVIGGKYHDRKRMAEVLEAVARSLREDDGAEFLTTE